jgi:FG-GAP repeat
MRTVHAVSIGFVLIAANIANAQLCEPFEEIYLTGPNTQTGDAFGATVAIDGPLAMVGAIWDDTDAGDTAGTVSVWRFEGGVWVFDTQLAASDAAANDQFGRQLALDGSVAVIGVRGDETVVGPNAGSAFVYRRSGGVWIEEAHLFASDAVNGDGFGGAVGIDDEVIIISSIGADTGASNGGRAYIFRRVNGDWVEEASLLPEPLQNGAEFGVSVSISGGVAVVGAWREDIGPMFDAGVAYVYRYDGLGWPLEATLVASDAATQAMFGRSIAVEGSRVLVGAWQDSFEAQTARGAAYVFAWTGSAWVQEAKLIAPDPSAWDNFGASVAMNGTLAIVGALSDDTSAGVDAGSATIFRRDGSSWSAVDQVWGSGTGDQFGNAVAISGDRALVGAFVDDTGGGIDTGSASLFVLQCLPGCPADLTGDLVLDFFDIAAFLSAFSAQQPLADWTEDGIFDFFDVQAYLAVFAAGCP